MRFLAASGDSLFADLRPFYFFQDKSISFLSLVVTPFCLFSIVFLGAGKKRRDEAVVVENEKKNTTCSEIAEIKSV